MSTLCMVLAFYGDFIVITNVSFYFLRYVDYAYAMLNE